MPDINGDATLRDRFPIYCVKCGLLIADDDYRVVGLRMGHDGIPMCLYAHGAELDSVMRTSSRVKAVTGNYCVYCGEACDTKNRIQGQEYCCDKCHDEHDYDMKKRTMSPEVLELVKSLRALTPPDRPHVPRNEGTHTAMVGGAAVPATKAPPRSMPEIDPGNVGNFTPGNELGLIFLFGTVASKLPYRMVNLDGGFPDALMVDRDGHVIRVEFEYRSSNFALHKHDPDGCDLVVCWELDRSLPLPVIALARHYDIARGTWDFSDVMRFAQGMPTGA